MLRLPHGRLMTSTAFGWPAPIPRSPSGTTVPSRWTIDAGRAFIDRQLKRIESGEGISAAIHALDLDRAVGLVSMMLRPLGVIGLGYWVVPGARQRGFARRAATLAGGWVIAPGGSARIEAWVEPDNKPSQLVLNTAGFELKRRLRCFLTIGDSTSDALVYARIAGSPS